MIILPALAQEYVSCMSYINIREGLNRNCRISSKCDNSYLRLKEDSQ